MITLANFKPVNNLVLLKAVTDGTERQYGKSKLILGVTQAAKDQYEKNYARRHFEVVKVPEKLEFPTSRQEFASSGYAFRYRTEIEIKEGDTVWVKLRSGHRAVKIIIEENPYYLVHYAELFVSQRRNLHRTVNAKGVSKNLIEKDEAYFDVIPLNGNIICEKVYTKSKSKLDIKDRVEEPGRLKVKFVGVASQSYFTIINDKFVEVPLKLFKVKPKDIIQADGPYINVEGEYFHDFNGESQPVSIHRTFIGAIL